MHELMAVGVHQGVLDQDVCYFFWADELMGDCAAAKSLIEYIRTAPPDGTRYTYADLERLTATWEARAERARQ